MRTVRFLTHIHGDFEVEVVNDKLKTLKKAHLDILWEDIKAFNPLEGFEEDFWDMEVKDFNIRDKQITILV